MAQNLNYNVNINTSNGVQALNNLQNKLSGVNNAFSGLKNAIGGLAIGAVITNLLSFADNLQDLSEATGIATEALLGFQRAVQGAGGSSAGADKAILRLVQNIGEAAGGSAELQLAFAKVGVSLKDLATLSEQQILTKVIEGLGAVNDKSTQAALKAQLLGKEFRNVATAGLAESFAQSTRESEKYAQSIARAAELQDNLDKAITRLKISVLDAISPIVDLINSMDQKKVGEFIDGLVTLGTVVAGLAVFSRLVAIVEALAISFGLAGGAAMAFGLNVLKNFTLIGRLLTIIGGLALGLKTLFPETFKAMGDGLEKAMNSAKEFFGIESPKFLDQAEVDRENRLLEQRSKALKDTGTVAREVKDPFEQLRQSIRSVADEYARMNELNIRQIELQTSLIGKGREESEVAKARADILRKEADEIGKLEERRSRLTEAQANAGIGKEIDAQIAKIKEQTRADIDATDSAIRNNQARIRAFDLEKFTRQSQIDVEKQIRDIQDEIATSTMGAMARKEYEILAAARERAIAEIQAEEVRRGSLLTDAEKQRYLDAALVKSQELINKNKELYQQSRSFETGWAKAFRDYVDEATNAAKAAERIFAKATQGMEDLIVNFAKTGKFEFKNFVNSMLEELLRSQVRQMMAQIFNIGNMGGASGQGGGGGLLSSIGNLLGFASGGVIPTNKPVLVGERGPEILSGVGGRVVTPNDQIGMGPTIVNYNISAVDARSFKDLVASDPSFIYAVSQQGSRGVPGRR